MKQLASSHVYIYIYRCEIERLGKIEPSSFWRFDELTFCNIITYVIVHVYVVFLSSGMRNDKIELEYKVLEKKRFIIQREITHGDI